MSNQNGLRIIVRGAYDIQKLRIQMGNRIVGNFKAKLGQEPGTREEELDPEAKALLADLRHSYHKLTDGVAKFPQQKDFAGDEVISTYTELCLLAQYISLEQSEKDHFSRLGKILREYPIFTEFLDGVKGVGPAMAGVLVSEIDIAKARYPSSLWKYAGLDVAQDGRRRSRRKEHLIPIEYTDKDGNPASRVGITFNPFLKTKLMGVLAASFLRAGRENNPYAAIYDDRKHRLESHAVYGIQNDGKKDEDGRIIASKLRRHNQALGIMVKQFLADLYVKWRELEGLPVSTPYSEGKLGLEHVA